MKLCKKHDSCAVVTCAKFCIYMIPYNGVTLTQIFHQIWIMMEKSSVKWAPVHFIHTLVCTEMCHNWTKLCKSCQQFWSRFGTLWCVFHRNINLWEATMNDLFLLVMQPKYFRELMIASVINTTRTTRTPAFWGYPPPPHDYPHYWVILDPRSSQKNNRSRTENVTERTQFSKSRSNDLEDIGQGQRSSHATHLLMLVIICTKYGKNPSRTVDATERTRFSRSRPNDLEYIGQGQRSSHATHLLMLVIICTKYGKNPSRTVDTTERTRFSRSRPNDLEDIGQGQRSMRHTLSC